MRRVLVFGVFDGAHEGHFSFLREARACGDCLFVAVARDEVVEKLKGRPPQKDQGLRIKELMKAGLTDEVIEGDLDLGSWAVIGKVKPDVIALGYDQVGLKGALEEHIREKGLDIEVRVMKAHKPEKYHSSILNNEESCLT